MIKNDYSISENFQIFQVSSVYVQVILDIGVTIDWDGDNRLYVKADKRLESFKNISAIIL